MSTILVIEDEAPVAAMLNDVLTDYGYEVVVAPDGLAALDVLEHRRPDVILCDEMMPRMAGHTFCELVAADDRHRTIPIVMMSAKHLETIPAPESCLMFIRKPFTNADLVNTMIDVLGEVPPYYSN